MRAKGLGMRLALGMIAGVCLLCLGCEGDGSGGVAPTVDVTGIWNSMADSGGFVLNLAQNGADVSGTASVAPYSAVVSGTVEGNVAYLTIHWPDVDETIVGTIVGDTMSGTVSEGDITVAFTATR